MTNGMQSPASGPESADRLWVVDVVAPLPPGRVRLVAADAAARLNLPAEKLVALLENRIGPVTKPLPRASADRVAEVLDTAGAEVEVRSARASDGPPSAARKAKPAGPNLRRRAEDWQVPTEAAPVDEPEERPVEPEGREPEGREAEAERAAAPDPARPTEAHASSGPSRPTSAEAPPETGPQVEREEEPAATAPPSDRPTPAPTAPPAVDVPTAPDVPPEPEAAPPSAGADREDAPPADPWRAMGEAAEAEGEDEAMLGDWRQPSGTPFRRREPPPTRPAAPAAAPGSAAGARTPPPSRAGEPEEEWPPKAVRVTHTEAGATPSRRVHVNVPDRHEDGGHDDGGHEDDYEDDESFGFGMRDPFAEAERREREVRRWVLGGALLAAAVLFLVLQWAYSRPSMVDSTPPPYEAGLTDYRRGAFVSAARSWEPRAEAGDAQAMYMLGYMAEIGQGRPWSNSEAAGWYRQAAARGHAEARLRLAALHLAGMGVERDAAAALDLTLEAARAGHGRAQLEAARLLAQVGRHEEAAAWLREAAVAEPEAAGWLGVAGAVQRLNQRSE